MGGARQEAIVDALLRRLLARHGARQAFLFGPNGEPFRPARVPVEREELVLLERALNLIERMECSRPKPFFARDCANDLLVAALEEKEDLYFVVLGASGDPEPVESSVAILRSELLPYIEPLRACLYPEGSPREDRPSLV